jgi:preprotein translocase subunit SecB
MKPSQLQLERHFFSKIHVTSNVDGARDVPNTLQCQLEVARSTDGDQRFQVTLNLKLGSPSPKKAFYSGEFEVVGFFKVMGSLDKTKIDDFVQANGAAMLFGATREMILNLTSRGPWPAVRLSSFHFVPDPAGVQGQSSKKGLITRARKESSKTQD